MSQQSDPVLISMEGHVATVTLDRPSRMNAFDAPTVKALRERLVEAALDRGVRAVVLAGAGRAFCAGGDLAAVLALNPSSPGDAFHDLAAWFHQCIVEIRTMEKPVIAAIGGPAAGGGFSLALACDLRVMGESAFLQQAYTSNGLSIDGGGSWTLPRMVGLSRALEIAWLDERIPAARALELGLATKVVPDDRVLAEAHALAARIAARAIRSTSLVKRLMNAAFDTPLESHLELERRFLAQAANSAEGREGLAAFSAKRAPSFEKAGGSDPA